jgi:hypothetical protein
VVQFVQILALALVLVALSATLSSGVLAIVAVGVSWGLVNLGALFDGAGWAGRSEWLRLLATPLAALSLAPGPLGLALAIGLAGNWILAWRLGVRWGAVGARVDRVVGGEAR